MSAKNNAFVQDEMRAEYDLSGGVRGKFFKEYKAGTNIVILDPDVATVFQDSEKATRALRLIDVAKNEVRSIRRKSRRLTTACSRRRTNRAAADAWH